MPLFVDEFSSAKIAICSRIFRILTAEIYSFSGKVDENMQKVLEKLTTSADNKSRKPFILDWNENIAENFEL